ncbi:MAG: hypothetical protein ACM3PR_01490 [Bacteroidales bacterium]
MAKVLMIKVMNFPGELRFPKAHFSFSFKKMQSQGGAALSKSAFFIFRFKKCGNKGELRFPKAHFHFPLKKCSNKGELRFPKAHFHFPFLKKCGHRPQLPRCIVASLHGCTLSFLCNLQYLSSYTFFNK